MTCWAAVRGDCSRESSQEHVISKSVFSQEELNIEGPRWLNGRKAFLPKKVLAAAILCKRHNEQLTELDATAGNLSTALRRLYETSGQYRYTLNGRLYERWHIKTMVNLATSGWADKGKAPSPPSELVDLAFGEQQLTGTSGLYMMREVSGQDYGADRLAWRLLTDSATASNIFGVYINMRGFHTVMTIPPGNPEPLFRALGNTDTLDFTNVRLVHHPTELVYTVHENSSQLRLSIDWS